MVSRWTSDFRSLITASTVTLLAFAPAAIAQDKPATAAKPKPKQKTYDFPGSDGPVEPFVPKKPETETEKKVRDSLAWYMAGMIKERRNNFTGALDDYRKAVELNPKAIEVYRSLVPLAFSLNRTADAIRYAEKAVELDPDDYRLARRLGIFMATQRNIPKAIDLLKIASQSKNLKKFSADFVTIQRDLGLMYGATRESNKAADAYQFVFEARQDPKKYNIDTATLQRLERDAISSYERIGQVFLDAKRPQLAIKAYKAAQSERKGRPGSLNYNLARVYHEIKQDDKALAELQKYLDAGLRTRGKAAYELLADILKAKGQAKQLVARLEALAKKDKDNAPLQYYLADHYVLDNRLKEAEALYKATMKGSDDAEALLGLAVIYRQQNRPQDWLDAVQRTIRIGRDPDALEQALNRLDGEVKSAVAKKDFTKTLLADGQKNGAGKSPKLQLEGSLILAKVAGEAKDTKATVFFYEFALKKPGPAVSSVAYGELGSYLLGAEKYKEAAKAFRDAVNDPSLRNGRPNFLFRLSQAEELAGNTAGALKAVHEAQKLIPGVALLHYQEGWIHYHARQWDKAIPLFDKVIRDFATNGEIVKRCKFSLSNIYVQKGDREKGKKILEEVYEQDPDDISVNNDLGYLYAEAGEKLEQAEKMIRKAVKAEPDNAAYLDSLGWVLYMRGKHKEAVTPLERATKLPNGGDATIWDHLGDCYNKLNRKADAKTAWENALKKAEKDRFPDKKLIGKIKAKLGMGDKPNKN